MPEPVVLLGTFQSVYYVVTGLWALFSIKSFMLVTGPKTDVWLVKTVGVLVVVIGAAIGSASWSRNIDKDIFILAVGSAGGLAVIDVVYAVKARISRIYLLDAGLEAVLVLLWFLFG